MKPMDEAVFYTETVSALGADPLNGETEADKELREVSARHAANMRAVKEVVSTDWGRLGVTPTPTPRKRKAAR